MSTNRIPEELRALPQWVLWRYEDRGGPKPTKVPITCQGYPASVTNPEHWSRFDYAVKMSARPEFADGIGFVFTDSDPYCGIDLDNIWPSDAAETPPWAQEILNRFTDTYSEESPSGQGAKIWCRARLIRAGKWPVDYGAIEIYDRGRYFAVTGKSNRVHIVTDHQADVESLVAYLGGPTVATQPAIGATIPYGTQHNALVSLAGTMRRRGMTAAAIEAALLVVNAEQCERPGPPENIHRIAVSAGRWLE